MSWLYYLAEANIYLGVFYLAYCLFLNKETYYQLNRAYLLFSCVISFVLPLLQIGVLKPVETAVVNTVTYAMPQQIPLTTIETAPVVIERHFTLHDYLWYGYLLGTTILLLTLLLKLYTLYQLTHGKQSTRQDKHKLIYLPETDVAFSFFNYLFIGANAAGANTIIRHELVHIRQKHSLDIIFLEILKVISWFNPFIYLIQNSLKAVHEYIADEQTAAYETDALTYSSFLVNNAYGAGGSSITHSFFNYNLLKKRIIMLNQQRSGNLARLKYLVAIPICVGLLCASTLAFSKTYGWVDLAPRLNSPNKAIAPPINSSTNKTKRLKVTQNGITITTDKMSVQRKGKQIFYTVNTITKNDIAYLLKNDKTKVEIVEVDDLPHPNKFPIPSIINEGYDYLHHHIMKSVHYYPTTNEKGRYVLIGFTVNKDGRLSDIKIDKSGGSKFDTQVLNAFKSYNLPVNDKPGHYKSVIMFYNYQKIKVTRDPEIINSWVIADWGYTVKHTSKGYEYDEYAESLPEGDSKIDYRTIIYEKNGKYIAVRKSEATPAEVKLLRDKYGYTFPKEITSPPPVTPSMTTAPNAQDAIPTLPSTFKPAKTYTNNKGYKIEEGGYTANGKTYYVAIINAKPGKKLSWSDNEKGEKLTIFKGTGNASGEETIYHQYGYKFPDVKVSEFKNIGPPPQMPIMTIDDGFNALRIYCSNKVEYTPEALAHEIQGNVVARFNVNKEHKITDVKLISGIGYGCDEQVISMLKSFKGTVNGKYNDYLVNYGFTLFGRTKSYPKVIVDKKISEAPNVALNIGLTGYGK